MCRYRRLQSLVLSLSCLLLTSTLFAQQDFSNVEIIPHHVAGSVYYLEVVAISACLSARMVSS